MGEDVNDRDYNEWPDELKFADLVYKLYKKGYLNSVSVGYDPIEWEWSDEGNINFLKQELLEVSAVPVPANPDAVQAGLKGADKQLISKYYNRVNDIISNQKTINIIDEKDENLTVNKEYVKLGNKKVTKDELKKIIKDSVAEVVKNKTGKII